MKKLKYLSYLYLLGLLILIPAGMVIAQDEGYKGNSRLGIKAGLNISNLDVTDVSFHNAQFGFHGGVFGKFAISRHFAIQPEVLFSTQGAELQYNNNYVVGTVTYHLKYLQVPLLAVYSITKNVNVHGGVYVASLLSTKTSNGSGDATIDFEEMVSKENFESLDYGLVLGVGGDIDRLNFGVRYNYGIPKIGKDFTFSDLETHRFPDGQNSNFMIYVGFSIL